MDDEEEDMLRPVSQIWGTPFRDAKRQDMPSQATAQQALVAMASAAAAPEQHNHGDNSIDLHNTPSCRSQGQRHIFFHDNAGFRPHFPAHFEPMGDRGEEQTEEEEGEDEEEHSVEERPQEGAVASVEVQIGRKLREIGDQFHQDHLELFLQQQREQLPVWMRLTMAVFGFLFPRGPAPPHRHLRGEER